MCCDVCGSVGGSANVSGWVWCGMMWRGDCTQVPEEARVIRSPGIGVPGNREPPGCQWEKTEILNASAWLSSFAVCCTEGYLPESYLVSTLPPPMKEFVKPWAWSLFLLLQRKMSMWATSLSIFILMYFNPNLSLFILMPFIGGGTCRSRSGHACGGQRTTWGESVHYF